MYDYVVTDSMSFAFPPGLRVRTVHHTMPSATYQCNPWQ